MEDDSHAFPRAENNFVKNAELFEKELKNRLKWNKQHWLAAGEANNRLNKLCNSLHFWKFKLKPAVEDVSIIVTLFNKDKDVRTEIFKIIDSIESLDNTFIVKGIANFRNPRYVCIYFENKEIRDRVKDAFRMLDDNFIVYLSWALKEEYNVSKLTIHWLPLTLDIEIIKEKLNQYVDCIEEVRKNLIFMSGREMPTAKIEFKVAFKKNVTADLVPHLVEINNMEALITIGGRKPLCLNCDRLGHISKECDLRYCDTCKMLKARKHDCTLSAGDRSYADTLKADSRNDTARISDEMEANAIVIDNQVLNNDKQILAHKINLLENQLKSVSELEICLASKRADKRKAEKSGFVVSSVVNTESSSSDWAEDDESISDNNMEFKNNEDSRDNSTALKGDNNAICSALIVSADKDKSNIEKKHNSKKKRCPKTNTDIVVGDLNKPDDNGDKFSGMTTRSYGKPIAKNPRRIKEELKSKKIADRREFIFQDP